MGGRGSSSGGGTGSVGGDINVKSSQSLISLRNEGKRAEADQVLTVLRDVEKDFGVTIGDAVVAKLGRGDSSVLAAMYRGSGDLLFNQRFFDEAAATKSYDDCVRSGFHPSRGEKSAIEAIAAHELGHRINYIAAENAGTDMDVVASNIVKSAARRIGMSAKDAKASISGYAKKNYAETVAEAYADVYCNGNGAKPASRAIVEDLRSFFRQRT